VDLDRTPAQIADSAGEEIRALAHRTLSSESDGWQYPGDAYSVVANLAYLASGLPQSLAQIRALLERLEGRGSLRSDKDTLGSDLHETYSGLEDARAAAEALYTALNRAHSGLGPIAYQE
jgi:hypothetical protein